MALQELMKARQLHYSADECSGVREFYVDGIIAGTSVAALASRPLSQLLASFPLGRVWYTDTHNLADVLPRLRVVSHDIIAWLSNEKAHCRVNYSSSRDSTREIQYWYDVGEEIQTVTHEVAAADGSSYSATRLDNNRNYPKSEPVTIFNYQRSECYYGFWDGDTQILWSALGGGTVGSWEEGVHTGTSSQFYKSQQLVGRLNGTGTFLGQSSKKVLYLGATVSPQGPMYVGGGGNAYVFTVLYRFQISTEEHFQYRHPDTGDLKDVRLRGNFNTLGLIWPNTLGGISLRSL